MKFNWGSTLGMVGLCRRLAMMIWRRPFRLTWNLAAAAP